MYSGSTLNDYSGRLLGAHQKIDRAARRHLERLLPQSYFPGIKDILHFEGNKGPDAIKRKSPAKDEPWHYLQPFDCQDNQLLDLIKSHHGRLIKALREDDAVRSAFEAAWLAHAIVDGLTPAHHYPYEEKLVELSGQSISNRTTVAKKLILPGPTMILRVSNNWRMWGPKGLFTTHAAFEAGVAMLIAPLRLRPAAPSSQELSRFKEQNICEWFREQAQMIANMELYDKFYQSGWTIPLARRVRKQLAPVLVQSVALVWYDAATRAGLAVAEKA